MNATIRSGQATRRVALLCGGTSAERDISLQSGAAVNAALSARGHDVTVIDPQSQNLAGIAWSKFDVAFIALHGTFGEDGGVQRVLEAAGIPFTGSSAGASRLAFSKSATKERLRQFNIPTPHGVVIHETDSAARIHQHVQSVGFPLVVKPDAQGSSLGVSIVRSEDALPAALSGCFHYHPFGILEEYREGEEWTVGVLDHEVLPPLHITPRGEFFDFQAKYLDDATEYSTNAGDSAVLELLKQTARRTVAALNAHGAVRVDAIVDPCGNVWVLELNTVPGLTAHSLLPQAAAEAGYTFGELCESILRSSVRTATRRAA